VEGQPDDEIVRLVQDGHSAAFGELMRRHYPDCLRYAVRMLGDPAEAEDVVQETFIRAFRALPRYQARERFRSWLVRILANRCRSTIVRASWRRARLRMWFLAHENGHAPPPALPGPDIQQALQDLPWPGPDIQQALQDLPWRLREAFLLKHVEDLSYKEMSCITGASESALKMRVQRACTALAEKLTGFQ
jgi:RNA polymerase sigma-70 factor, ECF subfamily